jgi:hypothetical protein
MNDSASARAVYFDERHLHVELDDGRVISTPMQLYPELRAATLRQLSNYLVVRGGTSIEWPELDYRLIIENLLAYTAK